MTPSPNGGQGRSGPASGARDAGAGTRRARTGDRSSRRKVNSSRDGGSGGGGGAGGGRSRARHLLAMLVMVASLGGITARLLLVQGVDAAKYQADGRSEYVHEISFLGERGSILDRDGDELAMSVPMTTVYADPYQVSNPLTEAEAIAPVLGTTVAVLRQQLSEASGFVYLARTVPDAIAAKVEKLIQGGAMAGIYTMQEPKRFDPAGQLAAPLVGIVGTDGQGLSGLEYKYNALLEGKPGRLIEDMDPAGGQIPGGLQEYQAPVRGDDLVLSIDEPLQYDTEQALARAIVAAQAQSGMALIMDSRTGDLLAVAQLTMPTPSEPGTMQEQPALPVWFVPPDVSSSGPVRAKKQVAALQPVESPTASAFTDVYEPGSVEKLVTISAALASGAIAPTEYFSVPNTYSVDGSTFSDAWAHPTLEWTASDILAHSSDIGSIEIAQRMGMASLLPYIESFGIGEKTDVNFPGESAGLVPGPSQWSGTSIATVPIGQGLAVTAVQMLAAYNTIAEGGTYIPPKLVDGFIDAQGTEHLFPSGAGHRVVSSLVAREMTSMLEGVVRVGTGTAASLEPYTVAGKTGTALVPSPQGGYIANDFVSSFAGFVPAEDPAITAMVVVEGTHQYGAEASAPVFAMIARDALQELGVPPHKPLPPMPGVPLATVYGGEGEAAGGALPGLAGAPNVLVASGPGTPATGTGGHATTTTTAPASTTTVPPAGTTTVPTAATTVPGAGTTTVPATTSTIPAAATTSTIPAAATTSTIPAAATTSTIPAAATTSTIPAAGSTTAGSLSTTTPSGAGATTTVPTTTVPTTSTTAPPAGATTAGLSGTAVITSSVPAALATTTATSIATSTSVAATATTAPAATTTATRLLGYNGPRRRIYHGPGRHHDEHAGDHDPAGELSPLGSGHQGRGSLSRPGVHLRDLLAAAGLGGAGAVVLSGPGELLDHEDAGPVVSDVEIVSGRAQAGTLFACIKGSRSDGHDFAADALGRGAVALLCEQVLELPVAQVVVPSVRQVLGPVAAAFWGFPSRALKLVGVTGTNGKTTTCAMLAGIFNAQGWPAGVIGTLTGERTTPEATVLQRRLAEFCREGVAAVAMEVSSHALEQHRVKGTAFAAGIFTNLSQDHLDYHITMEAYFAAKLKLFTADQVSLAVVNRAGPWGDRLVSELARSAVRVVTFALEDAGDVVLDQGGASFTWCGRRMEIRMGGRFNIGNAVAAATTARELGVGWDAITRGLAGVEPVRGRFQVVDEGQPFRVLVDFAHTPAALEEALKAARELAGRSLAHGRGRVLIVFGAGGDRDRAKRPVMGEVASTLADVVIITSDNPRGEKPLTIIEEVARGTGGTPPVIEPDRGEAIRTALAMAREGDAVLIAGKGHETGQDFGDYVEPFDDVEVARLALSRWRPGVGQDRAR